MNIIIYFFFMKTLFNCIILVIDFNISISLKIFCIIIFPLIVFTNIFFMWIILILIIYIIIFCFCIIRWSQGKIDWLNFVFSWLENWLNGDIWLFLRGLLFYINPVIIFSLFRCNMNITWNIVWMISWTSNNLKWRSIILVYICKCYVRYWCTSVGNYF